MMRVESMKQRKSNNFSGMGSERWREKQIHGQRERQRKKENKKDMEEAGG